MPKKKAKKSVSSRNAKDNNDFFFFLVVSVFAALTIFTASYLNTSRQEAIRASQKPTTIDLAPLDTVAPPAK